MKTPTRKTKGRRLTAEDQVRRNEHIRHDLSRGLPRRVVAERHGLSERQVSSIWNERRAIVRAEPDEDSHQRVVDELAVLEALMAEAAERGDATANDAVWLGSLKTRLAIQERRVELLRTYGMLPWGYDQLEQQARLVEIVDRLVDVLIRHKVPDGVFNDIVSITQAEAGASRRELRHPVLTPNRARPRSKRDRADPHPAKQPPSGARDP